MRRRATTSTAAVLLATLLVAMSASPAHAWMGVKWKDGAGGDTVGIAFAWMTGTYSFPGGGFQTRALEAMNEWKALAGGTRPEMHSGFTTPGYNPTNDCGPLNSYALGYTSLNPTFSTDLEILGLTWYCTYGGDTSRFYSTGTLYDQYPATYWYIDNGAVPAAAYDFGSLAAHEIGHALTLVGNVSNHMDEDPIDNCTSATARETMCSLVPRGNRSMRTIAARDRDYYYLHYP